MPPFIQYRPVTDNDELLAAARLESRIWGWDDRFASPTNVMRVTALKGGLVLCAYDQDRDGEMVGMSWAFPVRADDGVWALWSHVAGFLPEYRSYGLGRRLKFLQREWAMQAGYAQMRWTFDPMQAANANFNLNVLGTQISKISANMYGVYDDTLNPGLPTDRFEAVWVLDDPRVAALAAGEVVGQPPMPSVTALAYDPESDTFQRSDDVPESGAVRVELPAQFSLLGRERASLARTWQTHLREVLSRLFAAGWHTRHALREDGRCWYVVTPKP